MVLLSIICSISHTNEVYEHIFEIQPDFVLIWNKTNTDHYQLNTLFYLYDSDNQYPDLEYIYQVVYLYNHSLRCDYIIRTFVLFCNFFIFLNKKPHLTLRQGFKSLHFYNFKIQSFKRRKRP